MEGALSYLATMQLLLMPLLCRYICAQAQEAATTKNGMHCKTSLSRTCGRRWSSWARLSYR